MATQISNQHIYAGDTTFFHPVRFMDGLTPQNLSTWGPWLAHWRPSPESAAAPIVLTVDSSESNVGVIRVSATGAQTAAMGGPGWWDLQATRDGVVQTWVLGRTNWTQDVSRP